jgi:serine/threonine-protein kinase
LIGTLLASRYRLQALLGQGGMGVVYDAVDETTGGRVAVKLVHAEVIRDASSKDDSSKLGRFQREAKAAAAIQGDHVARTLDWGTDPSTGQPFIVMELLVGEDLQMALQRVHVLPPDVAVRLAAQACEGLMQAHRARVIHRDIKPANLFLAQTKAGEIVVKILDFGIAKINAEGDFDGAATGLTRTGAMLGSPKYMSPEQARGSRELDPRTDLWSLGVVLFRTLSGHMPHEDATAIGDFIILLCSETPPLVQSVAPWVSAAISDVVEDALRIGREQRYENAEAMLAALRALLPRGDTVRVEEITAFDASAQGGLPPQAPSLRPPGTGTGSRSGSRPRLLSTGDEDPTSLLPLSRAARTTGSAGKDDSATATASSLTNSRIEPARPSRRLLPVVLGMGIGAVLLAGLGFGLSQGTELFADHPAASASSPLDGPAPPPSGDANRRATLVILPDDAQVEIDSVPARPVDGVVKIVGAVGSVHRVRLRKDGQEKIAEVLIGPSGAEPPKVELVLVAAPATSAAPTKPGGVRPPTKKSATPGAPPPPRNPLIPERFE